MSFATQSMLQGASEPTSALAKSLEWKNFSTVNVSFGKGAAELHSDRVSESAAPAPAKTKSAFDPDAHAKAVSKLVHQQLFAKDVTADKNREFQTKVEFAPTTNESGLAEAEDSFPVLYSEKTSSELAPPPEQPIQELMNMVSEVQSQINYHNHTTQSQINQMSDQLKLNAKQTNKTINQQNARLNDFRECMTASLQAQQENYQNLEAQLAATKDSISGMVQSEIGNHIQASVRCTGRKARY